MKFSYSEFSEKYNDPKKAKAVLAKIFEYSNMLGGRGVNLMEVCGTHTHEICRSGVRGMLPGNVALRSGPGCPVCVTPDLYIDEAVLMARRKDCVVATFGDMLKVPGTVSSLAAEKSAGADVRVVYSPMETLQIAAENPSKNVVFLSVGFETTVPSIAITIREAAAQKAGNFYILEGNKTVPEALSAIASHPSVAIDGFILPGHVSAIIGSDAYIAPLARAKLPGVVCGFEYMDILLTIEALVEMIVKKSPGVKNQYSRVVTAKGNQAAGRAIDEVFELCPADWRGIGVIQSSGLKLRGDYKRFSAAEKFAGTIREAAESVENKRESGCRCGEVLLSLIEPPECPLFKTTCDPLNPVGACMVSSEGTCAAYYKYGPSTEKIEF